MKAGVANPVENFPQPSESIKTRDELGEMAGMSGRTFEKYETVIDHGVPELVEMTRRGDRAIQRDQNDPVERTAERHAKEAGVSPDQMRMVRGRRYNRADKEQGKRSDLTLAQNEPKLNTAERHAKDAGVSPATIRRDAAAVAAIKPT